MDTIEVTLVLNGKLGMDMIQSMVRSINTLKSPYGYTFCDVLEISEKGNMIIKMSYPRYYEGNNAYLINSISACMEVQRYFAENIMEYEIWKQEIAELKLSRVDIPFTYYMENDEEFNSYTNIFYIFAYVYAQKKNEVRPKAYLDMIDNKYETLVYSDNGKTDKSSNNRLMIYNQFTNLQNKLDEEVLGGIVEAYEDLPYRIRMEVSKRIRLRRSFNSKEFSKLNILGSYFEDYKNYILENILDFNIIDSLYNQWSMELSQELMKQRSYGKINYKVFILQNLSSIYDYEILRRALGLAVENEKTRESAVTKIRRILNNEQSRNNIIIMDTYAVLWKIRETIINYRCTD